MQDQRQLVDVRGVGGVDDRRLGDVAEAGDLALEVVGDRLLAAAHDHVGLDAAAAQLGDRVLRGLGLLLARRADERHERDVDVADVVAADVVAELADRLEERQDLDVADGAADLGDHHVDVVGGDPLDAALDLVGDVRDHLDGLAEVVATTLGGEHRLVDRAGGGVRVARQVLVDEALVVAEVEVGLATVVGHEHLAVLERVHRARIDVDVRVELLERDPQAAELEQPTERGRGQPLAERAGHPSRHENVLRHGTILRLDSRAARAPRREITIPRRSSRPRNLTRAVGSPVGLDAEQVAGVLPSAVEAGVGDPTASGRSRRPALAGRPRAHAWRTSRRRPPPWRRRADVGRGRHLGEVRHHEHLMAFGPARPARRRPRWRQRRRCRRRPRRTPACGTALAASAREHEPQRQHRSGQFATRGHPGERQQRRARVGRQQEPHLIARVVVGMLADLDRRSPRAASPAGAVAASTACASAGAASASATADGLGLASLVGERRDGAPRRVRRPGRRTVRARRAGLRSRRGTPSLRRGRRRTCGADRPAAAGARGSRPAARDPRRSTRPARASRRRCRRVRRQRRAAGPSAARERRAVLERVRARPRARRRCRRRRDSASTAAHPPRGGRRRRPASPPRRRARRPRPASTTLAASSSSTWKRSRSISRARARSSPPSAASSASISVRRARGGSQRCRGRCRRTRRARRAGWPSTAGSGGRVGRAGRPRRRRASASEATVARRPLTYARDRPVVGDHPRQHHLVGPSAWR